MSENNQIECPKCKRNRDEAYKAKLEVIKSKYGSLPADAYVQQINDLQNSTDRDLGQTLREDYELYLVDECLTIDYGCKCEVCEFEFNHNQKIDIDFSKET